MRALLLGSIGVLAETSDMQRDAFNRAFTEADLGWYWDRETYAQMLTESGGKSRIETYATQMGQSVDADALHARKSALFRKALADGVELRPGVAQAMAQARRQKWSVALVTTTSRENVDGVLAAAGVAPKEFDLIVDGALVDGGKPDPAAYHHALEQLSLTAVDALAVEDNPDGVAAAVNAGIRCLATPGALHTHSDFTRADEVQERLQLPQTETAT